MPAQGGPGLPGTHLLGLRAVSKDPMLGDIGFSRTCFHRTVLLAQVPLVSPAKLFAPSC